MKYSALLMFVIANSLYGMENEQQQSISTVPDRTYYSAPWRYEWDKKSRVQSLQQSKECVFCTKLAKDQKDLEDTDPDKYFVVQRFDYGTVVTTNSMPYSEGHIMLIPENHWENFTDLKYEALYEWSIVRNWAGPLLQKIYSTKGYNMGVNCGEIGGQSVKHIHEHVIPRKTEGFMGVVTNTRVIGEALGQTHEHVLPAFKKLYEMLHDGLDDELNIEKLVQD